MRRIIGLVALAAASASSLTAVQAEDSQPDSVLRQKPAHKKTDRQKQAEAKRDKAHKDKADEVIVVSATGLSQAGATTKTRTPIIDSPQTISIVTREEIELRASPTIADALSYMAGVQAEPLVSITV
ncbi:TonB-dependent receptor plug domain-containing protein [Asaia platycodi]|uniref:TonB-dependent receptor plug domain-containing protein n=1 Tax=Asaia platycodi TaxID=610243 RepID=UPI000AB2D2A7|nr:TonB-dependent receptor plug domain-containing protein [Asaia platycodi]